MMADSATHHIGKPVGARLQWYPSGSMEDSTNNDKAVVVVQMTINEDGKPENVEVFTPLFPAFDKIAVDVIRKCPIWKPRISHNRKQTASL